MVYSKQQFKEDLIKLGVKPGDKLLMHSSYKSLGGIEQGAEGIFDVLKELLGPEGTLLLPTLTYATVYEDHRFNANKTVSCIGYLPEYFRTRVDGVVRSLHPTHSCAAWGKDAAFFVKDHEKDHTPVGKNSPLAKLPLMGGKILMLGCNPDRNTSMHGVEEAADVYYVLNRAKAPVCYEMTDQQGRVFEQSVYRHTITCKQKYSRIVPLLEGDEVSSGKVLEADCVLMSAEAVWRRGTAKMKEEPLYFVDPADAE